MLEYAEMAKLTVKIRHQDEKKFDRDWIKFINYIKEHCKYVKTIAGLV